MHHALSQSHTDYAQRSKAPRQPARQAHPLDSPIASSTLVGTHTTPRTFHKTTHAHAPAYEDSIVRKRFEPAVNHVELLQTLLPTPVQRGLPYAVALRVHLSPIADVSQPNLVRQQTREKREGGESGPYDGEGDLLLLEHREPLQVDLQDTASTAEEPASLASQRAGAPSEWMNPQSVCNDAASGVCNDAGR
eukprot:905610-Rhodomonas_salina.1